MPRRNISKNVEAWLKDSHFDVPEDTMTTGLSEGDEPQTNKGFLAFEDKIEEYYNIDVENTEAKCKKMDFAELMNEYDRFRMLSELNEELINKLEESNNQHDRKSDEIMAEHESLQEEQAAWKQKVTAASKKYKIFQDEAKRVKREHRHNVVESEIIEQFHEHCKSEIRDIVGEIEEHREKMELFNEVKHIDVGQLLEESQNLVDENEDNGKLLASLRKELNDLKIGLIDDENETETIDDIQNSTDCEYTNDEIREINSGKFSGKAGIKLEIDSKTIGQIMPTRHSPTTCRSISPETDKFFKSLEENSTDLLVTSEDVSEVLDIITDINSDDRAINDIKYNENTWISETTTTISKEGLASELDVRGRSKTKIPRPALRNYNSAIRCENKVKRKIVPRKDRCTEYIKLPVKAKSVIDTNVRTQAILIKGNIMANNHVKPKQCPKNKIATNSGDVKISGPMEETVRTATYNLSTVSTGQSFTDRRSPRKLSPIGSENKIEKTTLNMTKLPPIKSQSGKNKSALTMEHPPPTGSQQGQELSKSGHTVDKNRPKIKTPMSNQKQLTKINATKEKNMKTVDCLTGSTKHSQGKSDIPSRQGRELSQPRKSMVDKNLAKKTSKNITSAVSKQKPFPNKQEPKKINDKLAESKTDSIGSMKRHKELPPLAKKESKRTNIVLKSVKLPPVNSKEMSKRKCVPLNNVCISAPLPPIKSPTSTRQSQCVNEQDMNSKLLKEENNRNGLQSKKTVPGKSGRNPGNSGDSHKIEEGVNVVGRANNLYIRKR